MKEDQIVSKAFTCRSILIDRERGVKGTSGNMARTDIRYFGEKGYERGSLHSSRPSYDTREVDPVRKSADVLANVN
jgi:hypothetical protein